MAFCQAANSWEGFIMSLSAKARGIVCLSLHQKAKYFCFAAAEQHSTCCIPMALEAERNTLRFWSGPGAYEGSTTTLGGICAD